jgi:predicted secreted protein
MSIPAIFVVFSVTWFIALYCLLPVRIRSREEAGDEVIEGAMKGAPSNPNLRIKAVGATVISAIITAIAFYLIDGRIVTLEVLERTIG